MVTESGAAVGASVDGSRAEALVSVLAMRLGRPSTLVDINSVDKPHGFGRDGYPRRSSAFRLIGQRPVCSFGVRW
jgi:hypothetical protein